jgi:hypothetical protein
MPNPWTSSIAKNGNGILLNYTKKLIGHLLNDPKKLVN